MAAHSSGDYHALALGAGLNIGNFGAVSLDVTHARSTLADDTSHAGAASSFRMPNPQQDGYELPAAGLPPPTSGFYNLDETTHTHMQGYMGDAEQDDANEATNWLDYYNLN